MARPGMKFESALACLKNGKPIRRRHWPVSYRGCTLATQPFHGQPDVVLKAHPECATLLVQQISERCDCNNQLCAIGFNCPHESKCRAVPYNLQLADILATDWELA